MTEHVVDQRDDAALIAAVRAGDQDAFGPLYKRHGGAALRLARHLNRSNADDLVAESFARVLAQLRAGKGPDLAFRAYLLTTLRRHHHDLYRRGRREFSTEDDSLLDQPVPFIDAAELGFERTATARAFRRLPERWQTVLWHVEVDGETPAKVAPILGLKPNAVSALLVRARDALREAYLQEHLSPTTDESCRETIELLAGYVRGRAAARARAKVDDHLDACRPCFGLVVELREMNAGLAAFIGPAVLGSAAMPFVATAFGPPVPVGASRHGAAAVGAGAAVAAVVVATSFMAYASGDNAHLLAGPRAVPAESPAAAPPVEPIIPTPTHEARPTLLPPTLVPSTPSDTATPDVPATATPTPTPTLPGATEPTPDPRPTATPSPTPTTPSPTPTTPALPAVMPLTVAQPVLVGGAASATRVVELTISAGAAEAGSRSYAVTFRFTRPPNTSEPGGAVTDTGGVFDSCDTDTAHAVVCTLTLEPGQTRTGQVTIGDSDTGGTIEFTSTDGAGESVTVAFGYPSVRE